MSNNIHFKDRLDAARQLAVALQKFAEEETVVFALPRGGVPIGKEIAKALNCPLDLAIVKKIGHPTNPEYAIGVISEDGCSVLNEQEAKTVEPKWLEAESKRQQIEAKRRRELYLKDRTPSDAAGKIAIIIDDGIATGLTMLGAIKEIRHKNPAKVVVAVPVSPKDTAEIIKKEVDEFIALSITNSYLGAVGAYYDDFAQVSDEEVIALLKPKPKTLLYAMPNLEKMAAMLSEQLNIKRGSYILQHFANLEAQIALQEKVENDNLILGTVAPPEKNIVELPLLCHTLRKEGAKNITAILPYLAYARQDKNEPKKSLAISWLAKILSSSGIDKIITVDIHSKTARDFFEMPIISLSPAEIFAQEIKNIGFDNATIIAPDEGARERCQKVMLALGQKGEVAYLKKQKLQGEIISTLHGRVTAKAVMVDDILDTGATLIAGCAELFKKGVKEIIIMVTHGLFTGQLWKKLFSLGVKKIYTTDTVFTAQRFASDHVSILSSMPLIRDYLSKI